MCSYHSVSALHVLLDTGGKCSCSKTTVTDCLRALPACPPAHLPLLMLQKPDNWRLACQTIVGDGTNTGTVTVQTKPQSK